MYTPPPPTHWYVDFPGLSEWDSRSVEERLFDNLPQAIEAAKQVYADSDLPKVIVCEYPSALRVVSIWGDRRKPTVRRRRRPPTTE
jgi:hypothetical protein